MVREQAVERILRRNVSPLRSVQPIHFSPSSSPWLWTLFLFTPAATWDPTGLPAEPIKESGTSEYFRFDSLLILFMQQYNTVLISRKDERSWTANTYAPYDDGHQWRKYGEKKLSNSNFPKFVFLGLTTIPFVPNFQPMHASLFCPPTPLFTVS
jgi:hypothetical protein